MFQRKELDTFEGSCDGRAGNLPIYLHVTSVSKQQSCEVLPLLRISNRQTVRVRSVLVQADPLRSAYHNLSYFVMNGAIGLQSMVQ